MQDVLAATRRAEEVTRNNCECTLNVALAYTSRLKEINYYRGLTMGIRNLDIHTHLICVYLTPCLMPGKK